MFSSEKFYFWPISSVTFLAPKLDVKQKIERSKSEKVKKQKEKFLVKGSI